ncbi:hypothetical protein J6590_017528 [Homalodisca vitripennis]|nr:hypothetical protein J6590_017528 [Homalodisca vitripennis]
MRSTGVLTLAFRRPRRGGLVDTHTHAHTQDTIKDLHYRISGSLYPLSDPVISVLALTKTRSEF